MTNLPVSSVEWRNETSTLSNISADNLTVLEYSIDPVKDELQGQKLTCVAVAGGTEYTKGQIVQVQGILQYEVCVRVIN